MKNKEYLHKLKRLAGSIRGRFVIYFVSGSILLLAVSSALNYRVMYDAVLNINERTTASDFSQIAVHLNNLTENINRQMASLYNSQAVQTILEYEEKDKLGMIYAINEFSGDVTSMIMFYPYIHSVYIYLEDGKALCATTTNMRRFIYEWDPPPSQPVREKVLACQSRNMEFVGGLTDWDFPLADRTTLSVPEPLVTVVRRITGGWLVFNITEEHFHSLYKGVAEGDVNRIRLVCLSGEILSSGDKGELGGLYAYFQQINDSLPGAQYTDNEARRQIFWRRQQDSPIYITNEISLEVYWRDLSKVVATVLLIFCVGLFVICVFFLLWMNRSFLPLKSLATSMKQVGGTGDYDKPILVDERKTDELTTLALQYNRMLQDLREFTHSRKQAEQELRESELKALRNQINPHFLYNTLNTIKWMSIVSGATNISRCITALGGIIQPLFKSSTPMCRLYEELELCRQYIEIMNIRYEGGITYNESIEAGLEEAAVLRFILQPLIENAISHGFQNRQNRGVINLCAYKEVEFLKIRVSDDGKGLTEEELRELNNKLSTGGADGIGLMNICRRLELRYGQPYGIQLAHNTDGGLSALLTLPFE